MRLKLLAEPGEPGYLLLDDALAHPSSELYNVKSAPSGIKLNFLTRRK